MTTDQKEYIKTNLKWPFTLDDGFSRYFILIAPIGITCISFSMFYGGFKYGHIYKDNFLNNFFLSALTLFLFGLWLTYFTLTRIKNENRFIALTLNANISFDTIARNIESLKWTIIQSNPDAIEFSTKISLFSSGEKVTLIKIDEKSILVNSRPFSVIQPFTINRDKVNFKKLQTILQ